MPPKSRLANCALSIHRIKSGSKPRGSSRHSYKVGSIGASCLSEIGTLCEARRSVNPRATFASTHWHAWIHTLSQVCESFRDINTLERYKFAKLLQSKQSQSVKLSPSTLIHLGKKHKKHYSKPVVILTGLCLFRMLVEHLVALARADKNKKKRHPLDIHFGCWDVRRMSSRHPNDRTNVRNWHLLDIHRTDLCYVGYDHHPTLH